MTKTLKREFFRFISEIQNLNFKISTIFISTTILFTLSWYFSNPNYFSSIFDFHKSFDIVYEDLTAFSAWFIIDSILFLAIPTFIVVFIFKEKLNRYGINFGEMKTGFSASLISYFLFLPIIYFISNSENFNSYFPLMQTAKDDLIIFIFYESLFLLFIFSWEFIFRGFLLFGLEEKFGVYAIFVQMIPFVLLHNGKPFIETFSAIFGALFLGYLALRTRSIFYGFLLHASILITLDILALIN